MAISSWHNAFDKVFQDGNRQFLPVSTLIEHVLFYGTLDVLKGLWSTIFTAAIRRDRERYLALAVMGANVSAVSWILSRFPLWSPFHALNMHVEFLSTTTKGPRFLARTNNIIPEILKVPIWFLVQWVQDDSVARTFENLMGYQEPGNPVYSSIFNSDLFLIASIIEDPSLINFVYSKTGVLSPSDYKLVLARMISTISSQEKQDQFYRILSSLELSRNQTLEGNKGLFCAIPMDDTLGLALSFSLLLEPSWSAELFLRGLVKSFDLGVSARVADVTKILERFESIPPYLTCRSKTEHLQAVDAEQLMSIIWPIIGMTPTEDYYEFSVLEQFVQETIDFLSLSSKRAGP
ncbi:hypothetical protein AOL_s00078g558 [Orbilia oligospora ATCC 24927]|uniref:Uncharacterized protein n=1 Tax=Arthrobotrys oligospora (strain ATCC 24927 / CBS 115.81 / DSM 1491) TaxID=756982 RepID=G1XCB1_ARTOA|nr:hypothetical protein AOL_s00078g558 [Orbilia oligospora ATCC 24927]EGX49174.1 hypothetical protein AOL_s00078g558 [Orbilia oligospora ATCC 24927]